jgi:hypothetical protein
VLGAGAREDRLDLPPVRVHRRSLGDRPAGPSEA